MLRSCRVHAAEMERGVATAASERAQTVDYGLRIVAQEQVGLAYAGWDRLLTRVALPAWRMGRWPSRLDAGVVSALTELSRRDRLAEGFTSRLGDRPACDLLEEPGAVDEAASLLAARLFHGGPAEPGPDWSPVDWPQYPEEVVDRKWRADAARLHRVLDTLGIRRPTAPDAPTLTRVMDHLSAPLPTSDAPHAAAEALATAIEAEVAREGAPAPATAPLGPDEGDGLWETGPLPLFPLQPPRTGRDLLADHVTAMVCCAAVDTTGAVPGLDWLDGPVLLVEGERHADLAAHVLSLVEDGDAARSAPGWPPPAYARRNRSVWSEPRVACHGGGRRRPGAAPTPKPPYPPPPEAPHLRRTAGPYHAPRVPEAQIPFTSIRDER